MAIDDGEHVPVELNPWPLLIKPSMDTVPPAAVAERTDVPNVAERAEIPNVPEAPTVAEHTLKGWAQRVAVHNVNHAKSTSKT